MGSLSAMDTGTSSERPGPGPGEHLWAGLRSSHGFCEPGSPRHPGAAKKGQRSANGREAQISSPPPAASPNPLTKPVKSSFEAEQFAAPVPEVVCLRLLLRAGYLCAASEEGYQTAPASVTTGRPVNGPDSSANFCRRACLFHMQRGNGKWGTAFVLTGELLRRGKGHVPLCGYALKSGKV
ncbi:hypothetical protein WMY93_000232 [Mugilogobius chulae]|uniref:Uncharacterized protein n=1 Tax=Mugilogobius chulae TaxID=88201 RepID=A0AAW0Q4H0_9GOBI